MLVVTAYNDTYRDRWDAYVKSNASGTLFHLIGWKAAVESTFGHKPHYIMVVEGEKIRGVLPLFEVKSRLFGHALVSVPYGVYGGIVASDSGTVEMLRNSAQALADVIRVDYLELRNLPDASSTETEVQSRTDTSNWFNKDLYVTFQRPIQPDLAANMNAIPRKQRAMVRKGEKAGLVSRVGGVEELAEFYSIYATNVRDLGTPVYPLGFFRALMEALPDAFILSVWKDGVMVAGVLTFVFSSTLLPYYGGGLREYFNYAINDFMYWELMRYGCEHGYNLFDFGRSKRETGSYKFKKNWGFEPTDLEYRFYLVKRKEMPNVSPLNPKYRLMINTWKRLPLPIANWLGPKLVRGIP